MPVCIGAGINYIDEKRNISPQHALPLVLPLLDDSAGGAGVSQRGDIISNEAALHTDGLIRIRLAQLEGEALQTVPVKVRAIYCTGRCAEDTHAAKVKHRYDGHLQLCA